MQICEVSQVLVDMNNALTVGRISIPLYEQRASGDECLWAVTTLIHEEYPVVGRGTSVTSLCRSVLFAFSGWRMLCEQCDLLERLVTSSSEVDGAIAGLQEGLWLNIWGRNTACHSLYCCQSTFPFYELSIF